ncbi:amidohydrolase family protein [Candidatus Frankia nodulisporulans]|uniref:amidohydrolase family protein n=1 Tax=Candidatus Frankia nodulisporulans TaxID=2060052 RepID=UPI0013D6656B|nr:amidohydrolase family protein [Candidatus Frankia nodulisporulans]
MADVTDAATGGLRLFDADNHYWETSDAFTRFRDPKFADRGVQIKEIDGVPRYVVDGVRTEWLPGPADMHPRPLPGAFLDYFQGGTSRDVFLSGFTEKAADHPDWFERDARLKVMDSQGVDATWVFPSQGVVLEPLLHTDTEAAVECYRAFNRWIDDQWGFAYQNRIFGVPFITLCDPEEAARELRWCAEHGARVVNIRHGAAVTRAGNRSPADPIFDRFWGLAAEAGIVVASHDGSDETYTPLNQVMDDVWGEAHMAGIAPGDTNRLGQSSTFAGLTKHRTVHDFAYVLVAHRLFERFPKLRFAYIENGCAWVPSLLLALDYLGHGGGFSTNPRDQFIEHCWVAPFVEEDVRELARHLPVERILFGSDWPHGEGFPAPSDFLANVADFSAAEQQRIMYDNARELTFPR